MKRWMWWGLGLVGAGLALRIVLKFPWQDTGAALVGVNLWLLGAAFAVNLLSPVAKAWGWQLLLRPLAPARWWTAQEANLVGTAVNIVGVGVSGEAARITLLHQRDGVPVRAGVLSVIAARAVEALGLALFVVIAPTLMRLPPPLRGLQIGAALALASILVMARFQVWARLVPRLPAGLRLWASQLAEMGGGGRLVTPTILGMANWVAQWAAYQFTLQAMHIPARPAASFTAMIAVNLGGIVRMTPANIGVMQAAMAGALLAFGVPAERGVAAGFALQAIQVLPILAFGVALVGRTGLKRLLATPELTLSPPPPA